MNTSPEIAEILKSFNSYIEDALERHSYSVSQNPDSFEFVQENLRAYKKHHYALMDDLNGESFRLQMKFNTNSETELTILRELLTNAINKSQKRFKEKSRGK